MIRASSGSPRRSARRSSTSASRQCSRTTASRTRWPSTSTVGDSQSKKRRAKTQSWSGCIASPSPRLRRRQRLGRSRPQSAKVLRQILASRCPLPPQRTRIRRKRRKRWTRRRVEMLAARTNTRSTGWTRTRTRTRTRARERRSPKEAARSQRTSRTTRTSKRRTRRWCNGSRSSTNRCHVCRTQPGASPCATATGTRCAPWTFSRWSAPSCRRAVVSDL